MACTYIIYYIRTSYWRLLYYFKKIIIFNLGISFFLWYWKIFLYVQIIPISISFVYRFPPPFSSRQRCLWRGVFIVRSRLRWGVESTPAAAPGAVPRAVPPLLPASPDSHASSRHAPQATWWVPSFTNYPVPLLCIPSSFSYHDLG